ncbi:MAG: metallophosphoesterase, partial [Clostridia bacterium]|nr:metallophosphoesterase [Clostridia bacterium]
MKIWAISDLHLSFKQSPWSGEDWETMQYKPMSALDEKWQNHARQIYDNWQKIVNKEDMVLMPGDISWAMRLPEAKYDFEFLGSLPGTIVAIAGNHDYWWQSLKKSREAAPANLQLLQNDFVRIGDLAVCGSRGWLCPNGVFFTEADQKIYKRELLRLENSLQMALKSSPQDILVMIHYMPTNEKH